MLSVLSIVMILLWLSHFAVAIEAVLLELTNFFIGAHLSYVEHSTCQQATTQNRRETYFYTIQFTPQELLQNNAFSHKRLREILDKDFSSTALFFA